MSEKRLRRRTAKGQAMFEQQKEQFESKCEDNWNQIEDLIVNIPSLNTIHSIRKAIKDLDAIYKSFCRRSEEYKSFLVRTNTAESQQLLNDQNENFQRCTETYRKVSGELKRKRLEMVEQMSEVSGTSAGSGASQKRARAEAEKVRLQYIKKENELIKQKVALEADINVIKQECKVAAAETEARILEQDEQEQDNYGHDNILNTQKDVHNYIRNLPQATSHTVPTHYEQQSTNVQHANIIQPSDYSLQGMTVQNAMSDISRSIFRKDFLLSRFVRFDDKPESYESWRASFQSITSELGVSPFEEMDLLVKWLGKESSRFASSIRNSTAHDPPKGLQRIYDRLYERYGRPEMVENALKRKLSSFPVITSKDNVKLYDLLDILTEIESVMLNPQYASVLSYFDSSSGVIPIVSKLPHFLQEKWTTVASAYKRTHSVIFPPFSIFVNFIRDTCEIRNDPAFTYNTANQSGNKSRQSVITRKVDITSDSSTASRCPLHKAGHSLNDCRAFRKMSFIERKKFLRDKKICYKCCQSNDHTYQNCTAAVKCKICGNSKHMTAMHIDSSSDRPNDTTKLVKYSDNKSEALRLDGGESNLENISAKCTTLCGDFRVGRSCGKTVLVDVYSTTAPHNSVRVYAAIDDQSNRTLASSKLLDKLGINGKPSTFNLASCSGKSTLSGRLASGIYVQSVSNKTTFELPDVIECNSIPCDLPEIATPEVASAHIHLQRIAQYLPQLEPSIKVELLIGRDIPEIHHVEEQITGGKSKPFAQKLPLGWVIVGEVCLGKVHTPSSINVKRTQILENGRSTTFPLCEYNLQVSDVKDDIFVKTPDDNKVSFSVEDRHFIALMESNFKKDKSGHWSAPLPFKQPKPPIPNNRAQAWKRAQVLDTSLHKDPVKLNQFMTFMDKVLESGAAEKAPSEISGECWYLPLFGVHHPRKPNEIRGVFDSSAVYKGMSLNSVLMSGPDLTNNLVGVIMRFRLNEVAIIGDIEQMFYQFRVTEPHRNYLRFFWYDNNNINQPLIEYRMTSHVFGNSPSPAVATFGLRLAVSQSDEDVKSFVNHAFYVDDGLTSVPSVDQAITLIKKTQKALKDNGNIRFHKIVSNNVSVMKAFPNDDLVNNLKNLDLSADMLPTQRSLGISWDLKSDNFLFQLSNEEKPATRRGILSSINSLYDPLGFVSPITISGKLLLRSVIPPGTDWDEPLSVEHQDKWKSWHTSLQSLQHFEVPRMIVPISVSLVDNVEIHIFCDASEQAISAVAYLKAFDNSGKAFLGFLIGKSKLAPIKGHTIPRLELCSAVLATDLGRTICANLKLSPEICRYYTDSQVTLGYICNTTRRFFTYVTNRVEKIHDISNPSQWAYITTEKNPADLATRFVVTSDMAILVKRWIEGPSWLLKQEHCKQQSIEYPLITPNDDKEIRPEIVTLKTKTCVFSPNFGSQYFNKFSSWKSLVRAISFLRYYIKVWKSKRQDQTCCIRKDEPTFQKETERFIIRQTQAEVYVKEIDNLKNRTQINKNSSILSLDPFIDEYDIIRVGGRLRRSNLTKYEKNPILIPGSHCVAKLLVIHCHHLVQHQGRHLTEGKVRSEGFWITGLKRIVFSEISKCVLCKRFRGNTGTQKMSDLPEERLKICPPFSYVGIDCFGPWEIITRRTRGGCINSKRWAVLFSCLSSRAVHIEVIEDMSTSAFINALRRFISIRGKVTEIYSDRGSNFIGCAKELGIPTICVEEKSIKTFLNEQGISWKLNTPYSSHMGGSWERLIGIARRIIDSILYDNRNKKLTHDVLCTFMAETTAIMNSRPLVPISSDIESPCILTPNSLLTTKSNEYMPSLSNINIKDVYNSQWKLVQLLAEQFWARWQKDYIQNLQPRRKWQQIQTNIKEGDIVILKETDQHRNCWPLAVVEHTFPSRDNLIRKLLLRTVKDGQSKVYVRPITQVIPLCID